MVPFSDKGLNWRFPDGSRAKTKYIEYLQSAHWVLFKFNVVMRRGLKCERCGGLKDIDLHHKTYGRIGREADGDVELLCRVCHRQEHLMTPERIRELNIWLSR